MHGSACPRTDLVRTVGSLFLSLFLSFSLSLSLFRAPARSRPQLGNKRVGWAGWALGSYSLVLPIALAAARGTASSDFARPTPLLQVRAKSLEVAPT